LFGIGLLNALFASGERSLGEIVQKINWSH
jgi:hypothetical protein